MGAHHGSGEGMPPLRKAYIERWKTLKYTLKLRNSWSINQTRHSTPIFTQGCWLHLEDVTDAWISLIMSLGCSSRRGEVYTPINKIIQNLIGDLPAWVSQAHRSQTAGRKRVQVEPSIPAFQALTICGSTELNGCQPYGSFDQPNYIPQVKQTNKPTSTDQPYFQSTGWQKNKSTNYSKFLQSKVYYLKLLKYSTFWRSILMCIYSPVDLTGE